MCEMNFWGLGFGMIERCWELVMWKMGLCVVFDFGFGFVYFMGGVVVVCMCILGLSFGVCVY